MEYASAPRDIVATGINLPFVPGNLSISIGNTSTTGKNSTGIPLVDMITGHHTKAYYRDKESIKFVFPQTSEEIINYQKNIWGEVGPKTNRINFNGEVFLNNEEDKK